MSQADLVTDLKAILNDSKDKFKGISSNIDADFQRQLTIAARDMGRVRPRTRIGNIALVAEQSNYPAPADVLQTKFPLWGTGQRKNRKPWQSNWPGILPVMQMVDGDAGNEIYLSPAPTAKQMTDLGSEYQYYYFATHSIAANAANTTVKPVDRELLLIRATAQAMLELSHHNIAKPVQLGTRGIGSMPKNGTPSALADKLLELFERMAA